MDGSNIYELRYLRKIGCRGCWLGEGVGTGVGVGEGVYEGGVGSSQR